MVDSASKPKKKKYILHLICLLFCFLIVIGGLNSPSNSKINLNFFSVFLFALSITSYIFRVKNKKIIYQILLTFFSLIFSAILINQIETSGLFSKEDTIILTSIILIIPFLPYLGKIICFVFKILGAAFIETLNESIKNSTSPKREEINRNNIRPSQPSDNKLNQPTPKKRGYICCKFCGVRQGYVGDNKSTAINSLCNGRCYKSPTRYHVPMYAIEIQAGQKIPNSRIVCQYCGQSRQYGGYTDASTAINSLCNSRCPKSPTRYHVPLEYKI